MTNISLLMLCMFFGILLRRYSSHAIRLSLWLRKIVVWVCLPAMVFAHMPQLKWQWQHLYPLAMPYLNFVLSCVFFLIFSKLVKEKFFSDDRIAARRRLGTLILMGGLGNTSFVGFPVLLAFYGQEALKTAIVIDQAGSFIVISTLGLFCASFFSGKSLDAKTWLIRTLSYPSFLAFIISIFMGLMHYQFLPSAEQFFHIVSSPLSYLALILTGLNLRFRWIKTNNFLLGFSLLFKLILFPLIILALYLGLGLIHALPLQVTVIEAAMPPMVSAGILALEYRLDEELAMLHLAVGIPLAFVTLLIWYYGLQLCGLEHFN